MAVNVCPKCRQVTLSLGEASSIRCPICETVFEPEGEKDKDGK